ncbi:hypothetical protein QJS66_22320 [Kocuria rhizophila]|nr:hypothetical protein QJS66_22320 [Kocuria rhizophila]
MTERGQRRAGRRGRAARPCTGPATRCWSAGQRPQDADSPPTGRRSTRSVANLEQRDVTIRGVYDVSGDARRGGPHGVAHRQGGGAAGRDP